VSRTHTSFSLCFQVDVIQNRSRSEHAKMRRIRGTVSHFSLYFQLVGLAAEIRTVHETEDYGGVICILEAGASHLACCYPRGFADGKTQKHQRPLRPSYTQEGVGEEYANKIGLSGLICRNGL